MSTPSCWPAALPLRPKRDARQVDLDLFRVLTKQDDQAEDEEDYESGDAEGGHRT